VFPKDLPPGLPPLRGIEHQIDLIPGTQLPNRAPYRTNPDETKEIRVTFVNLLALARFLFYLFQRKMGHGVCV
jgi:hypothetical protein